MELGDGEGDFETQLTTSETSMVKYWSYFWNILNVQVASAHSVGGMVGAAISGLFLILAKKIGLSENHHCCFQYKCDYRLHLCLQKVSTASSLFLLCSQSYHVSLSLLWTRLAFRLLSPHLTLNQSCLFVNSHFPCSSLSLSPKIWKGGCCGGRTILVWSLCHGPGLHSAKLHLNCGAKVFSFTIGCF